MPNALSLTRSRLARSSTRRSLAATPIVLSACLLVACPPGTGPGLENLRFRSNGRIVDGKIVLEDVRPQAWGPIPLGVVSLLPLDHTQNITVQYTPGNHLPSTFSDIANQAVYLFARDPREYHDSLAAILDDPAGWRAQTTDCANPHANGVPFPQLVFSGPSDPPVGPFYASDFFFNPAACAATQDTPTKIQSAAIYHRGACSAAVPIGPIMQQLQDGLWSGFATTVTTTTHGCANAAQPFSLAASFLSHTPNGNPDYALAGGFMLDADLVIDPLIGSTRNLRFNVEYQFTLDDGILAVVPSLNATGYDNTINGADLSRNLLNAVPNALHNGVLVTDPYGAAKDGQLFDNTTVKGDCTQADDAGHIPVGYDGDTCSLAINYVVNAVGASGTNGILTALGSSDPTSDAIRLRAKVLEEDPAAPGKLKNWHCTKRFPDRLGSDPRFRCEYVVRAERLNVYPTNVELVWFDSVQDRNNTALPLYITARTFNLDTSKLCAPRSLNAYDADGYWSLDAPQKSATTEGTPVDCALDQLFTQVAFLQGLNIGLGLGF